MGGSYYFLKHMVDGSLYTLETGQQHHIGLVIVRHLCEAVVEVTRLKERTFAGRKDAGWWGFRFDGKSVTVI